jgi:uncharacterized protein YyaL (SSP411 family)
MVASRGVLIRWREWDEAVGERLVVVGAKFDHATHVLDAEAFDDPEIAARIEARFVPVRVDADARPELDARFQQLSGARGWPIVIALGADGRPTGLRVRPTRADLLAFLDAPKGGLAPVEVPPRLDGDRASLVRAALARMGAAADFRLGGFGRAPKLPSAPALALLVELEEPAWARPFVERTLNAIAGGGLHDQLAGGFHRASTDDRWVVPQFGKRAVDQAALITLYARAAVVLAQPRFAEVARRAAAWVMETLAAPEGGYFSSEDADCGAYDDASYHTFTLDEARAALDADELSVAQPWFDIYGRGELHSDPTRNVLFVATSLERVAKESGRSLDECRALIERARDKLRAAQRERPHPEIDRAIWIAPSAHLARALLALSAEAPRGDALLVAAREHALRTVARIDEMAARAWPEDATAGALARHAAGRTEGLQLDSDELPFLDGATESVAAQAARFYLLSGERARAEALVDGLLPRAAAAGVAAAGLCTVALALGGWS